MAVTDDDGSAEFRRRRIAEITAPGRIEDLLATAFELAATIDDPDLRLAMLADAHLATALATALLPAVDHTRRP